MKTLEKYGLTKNDLSSIAEILYENQKVSRVVLFGSRATGEFRNGSDIDLVLKGRNLHLEDILNASIALDDLYLPYKIDLLIYDQIEEKELLGHIDKYGIVLKDPKTKTNLTSN